LQRYYWEIAIKLKNIAKALQQETICPFGTVFALLGLTYRIKKITL
jgi:hypothetical protein